MKFLKSCFMAVTGLLSAIYLMNIGVGVVELIPDNIPLAGNIDEAIAILLLINALAYFGIHLRGKDSSADKLPKRIENQ